LNLLGILDKAVAEITPYTILYREDMDQGDTLVATSATVTVNPGGNPTFVPYKWFDAEPPAPPPTPVEPTLVVNYAIYTNDPTHGPFTKIMLSGGTLGMSYSVVVTSNTNDGRVMVDKFTIKIR